MGNEDDTSSTSPPDQAPLAVRRPRRVEAEPAETETDLARMETVLASLRPGT